MIKDNRHRIFPTANDEKFCVKLPAPFFKTGEDFDKADQLKPVSGEKIKFIGKPNSIASGITSTIITEKDDTRSFIIKVESSSSRQNVQLIQSLELDLSYKSYVIAPGAIYNGNRFIVSPQPYCPHILTEGISPDGPIVVTDVPRLCSDTKYSVELAANTLTIPAVGIFDAEQKIGFIIGTEIYGKWGVTGIDICTLPEMPIVVKIALPVMRRQRYHFCDWIEANEKGMNLNPEEPIQCRFRIIPVKAETIPEFISTLSEYGYANRGNVVRRSKLSFAETAELIENKLDFYNWYKEWELYTESMKFVNNIDFSQYHYVQTGWTCGGVTFYAMARSDKKERRQRAMKMMDKICREALAPSGYFHGFYTGRQWRSFGTKRPGCRAGSLVRRPLECTRDILKTIEVIESRGESVKSLWENAAKANLDAVVDTVRRFGHLGYTVDFDNGDVLWGDSCCGAFGIEALIRGYKRFALREYLTTAERLAEYYVENFVNRGYTCGGVGDALMACDSESSYALLSGMVALFEVTQNPLHINWAAQAADLFSTWVIIYDPKLPADSPLGRLGVQARGAVVANIQNQHGAPGICTASGDALLKLYQATEKERYLRLLEDIAQCIPQMIVRSQQEYIWKNLPPGSISERLMTMDGMEPCGYTSVFSAWPEISMLHTIRELPPVYYDKKRKIQAVFDVSLNR